MKIILGDLYEVNVEEGDHLYAEEYNDGWDCEVRYKIKRDGKVIFKSYFDAIREAE